MLIFDEIHVRKEMTVCSQTMTYAGLVDNGEQGVQSNELADHGLFSFWRELLAASGRFCLYSSSALCT